MNILFKTLSIAVLGAMLTVLGYRLGAGTWPSPELLKARLASASHAEAPAAGRSVTAPERLRTGRIIYWKHPDGVPRYASGPATTEDGRAFVAVHEDEESPLPGEQRADAPQAVTSTPRKILYYRNPMGLPDTSPVPKKDSMGMDYIAVYEGEDDASDGVRISVAKMQRTGVRSEPSAMRRIQRPIHAPGIAKPDERTLHTVALRADGFIERLYVNETGRQVAKGEPLFRIYSPDMVKVQVDYRISTNASGASDEKGALQRLANLQVPEAVVSELRRTREPVISFDWPSPVSGVVMAKKVIEGMMTRAGDEMLRLADLSSIWVIADVAEQDLAQVRIGAKATVRFRAFPGESFEGRITFILNELEMATRSAKVRVEVANPDHRIKYEMFADVEINSGDGDADRLAVPLSALIDSGDRQVVLVDRGGGLFEPRPVKVGLRGDDYVEIKDGISAGENVVVTANFLIDAESNLKAALSRFGAETPQGEPGHSADTSPEMSR